MTQFLIENFRPGKMEEWGLGYEALKAINPRLVMARISGYGQFGQTGGNVLIAYRAKK